MANYETHDFYCMNCGQKMPLMRKRGHKREKMHRKKLYCPFCQEEVNFIECKTYDEVLEFREKFQEGAYKEEADKSIQHIKSEVNMNE